MARMEFLSTLSRRKVSILSYPAWRTKLQMTDRFQSVAPSHIAHPVRFIRTSSRSSYAFCASCLSTKEKTGRNFPLTVNTNDTSNGRSKIVSNCQYFSTQPPYDPKKDAYIHDILREFGRDFSAENKMSDSSSSSDIGSGYESDTEPIERSSNSSVSSTSSDSDDSSDSEAGNLSGKGQGNVTEVKVDTVAECGGIERVAEVNDELAEYEEIEAYSDEEEVEEIYERIHAVPLQRGETGVFDIEELVAVLRDENAANLCVMEVPKSYSYVDFMVVCSGRSVRHIRAMAEYVKLLYKKKKGEKDPFLKIEGLEAKDWVAMDLGNIALHLFLPQTREIYDLESLWAVGGKYDEQTKGQEDAYAFLFDQQVATPAFDTNVTYASAQEETRSEIRRNDADQDAEASYEMHSNQWHQIDSVNLENTKNVDRWKE